MEEDIGKGLQLKDQDELIGIEGVFKKRTGLNKFNVPTQTTSNGDIFVVAPSGSLSTIPRSIEEHEELDVLNNKSSERLDSLSNKNTTEKEIQSKDKDKFNGNKKRVVTTQG
ncbi:unnamed protein product [Rhizophagus irregularis]|nr:unnamed protein product [Rhizophagus irregularis]